MALDWDELETLEMKKLLKAGDLVVYRGSARLRFPLLAIILEEQRGVTDVKSELKFYNVFVCGSEGMNKKYLISDHYLTPIEEIKSQHLGKGSTP